MKRGFFTIILFLGLAEFGYGAWIPAKAWLSQVLLERAWQETLTSNQPRKPWPWADTWPVLKMEHMDSNTSLLVLASSSGESLAFGPGHMANSGLPGDSRNIVISGHRDTHFRFIKTLQPGDIIRLTGPSGSPHFYRIYSRDIVDANQHRITDTHTEILTLVTCYPFDAVLAGGPLRYIVSAEKVDTKSIKRNS